MKYSISKIASVVVAIALFASGYFSSSIIDRFFGDEEKKGGGSAWSRAAGPGEDSKGGRGRPGAATSAAVDVTAVQVQTFSERVSGAGRIAAEREVQVTARVEGPIQALNVDVGDFVKAGDVLLRIDEAELQLAVDTARIEMEQAIAEFDRFSALAEGVAASPQELDDRRFAKERTRAAYDRALLDLTYARPLAPFDGVVTTRTTEVGQAVRIGDVLLQIADLDPLQVDMFLPERDVERVSVGARANLRLRRQGEVLASGLVTRVSPVVDRESLTIAVEVSFPNASDSIRPGTFGRVEIVTREVAGALTVPVSAVQTGPDGRFVWVVRAEAAKAGGAKPGEAATATSEMPVKSEEERPSSERTAEAAIAAPGTGHVCRKIPVEVGLEQEGFFQVTGELKVGDRVVVAGAARLVDRAPVEIRRDHSRVDVADPSAATARATTTATTTVR